MTQTNESALGPPPRFDLTEPPMVQRFAQYHGIIARKGFSQHWLVDRDVLDAIVAAGEVTRTTNVIEVGAGMGVLTAELARRAGRVVAVELEHDVLRALKDLTKPYKNVEIIKNDVLQVDPAEVFGEAPYRLIANLPYAITSITLRHFLEGKHPPERMVILIQREVADRILAEPGEMSLLSLSVQFYATPRFVLAVPPRSFLPPPKVNSAVIALDWHPPAADNEIRARVFTIAKLCFSQRRKQLHNTLPGIIHLPAPQVHAWLESAGISPDRRPQTLSLAEWIHLVELDPRRKDRA